MTRQNSRYATYTTVVCLIVIVALYIFFPAVYVSVSQPVFSFLYGYNAPSKLITEEWEYAYKKDDKATPLYVVARPPQTPYDSMLVTSVGDGEEMTGRYVYDHQGMPVGYVHEQRGSLYMVLLFSSSLSIESFSVNGYVTEGTGIGSGSFLISVPISNEVLPGTPIIHQVSGRVGGFATNIEKVVERNIQRLRSTIAINPIQTPVLYVLQNGGRRVSGADREVLLKNTDNEVEKGRAEDGEIEQQETGSSIGSTANQNGTISDEDAVGNTAGNDTAGNDTADGAESGITDSAESNVLDHNGL